MGDVKATARVKILLDIPVSSGWGPECTIVQVHKQAAEDAGRVIELLLQKSNLRGLQIEVVAVHVGIVEEKR